MPSFLDTLISGLAHVPPRVAGAPQEPSPAASVAIFTVLIGVVALLLMATLAAI